MQTKVCTKCKQELSINQFQADKRRLYGVGSECKDCKHIYRQANKDKLLIAQYQRRSKDKTLFLKTRAWNALHYALKTGKREKPDVCSIGGEFVGRAKIQGHHSDYSKPLSVVWCCQDCHIKLDKVRRGVSYA